MRYAWITSAALHAIGQTGTVCCAVLVRRFPAISVSKAVALKLIKPDYNLTAVSVAALLENHVGIIHQVCGGAVVGVADPVYRLCVLAAMETVRRRLLVSRKPQQCFQLSLPLSGTRSRALIACATSSAS